MKIQRPPTASPVVPLRPTPGKAVPAAGPPGSTTTDRVSVSREAEMLQKAKAPEQVDQARIDRLRDALKAGTFEVNPEQIVDRMLKEET